MEINLWQIIFQAVNFGVVLFLLNRVLYKPVIKMLDDRAKKINEGQLAAEKNLKASAELDKEQKAVLAKARKEAAGITREATAEAKKQAEAILYEAKQKAAAESAQMHKNAEESIAKKQKEMESSIKDLVVATSKKMLESTLSASDISKINKAIAAKLK